MDLAEVLDATEPVECEFLGKTITAHVYTHGPERLTKEERIVIRGVITSDPAKEVNDEDMTKQAREQIFDNDIEAARKMLPVMIKSWDLDGSPMQLRGEWFPPKPENMPKCPDLLLMSVAVKVVDVWRRPMNGDQSQDGSPQAETPGQNQVATITP